MLTLPMIDDPVAAAKLMIAQPLDDRPAGLDRQAVGEEGRRSSRRSSTTGLAGVAGLAGAVDGRRVGDRVQGRADPNDLRRAAGDGEVDGVRHRQRAGDQRRLGRRERADRQRPVADLDGLAEREGGARPLRRRRRPSRRRSSPAGGGARIAPPKGGPGRCSVGMADADREGITHLSTHRGEPAGEARYRNPSRARPIRGGDRLGTGRSWDVRSKRTTGTAAGRAGHVPISPAL